MSRPCCGASSTTDPRSSPVDVEELVREVRRAPGRRDELVALLAESAPVHRGRSTAATAQVRAWILASFEDVGLPDGALPYVLEELEVGVEPVLVAAAAKAVRGTGDLRVRGVDVLPYLLTALRNTAGTDAPVSFDALEPRWPSATATTATHELIRTIDAAWPRRAPRDELVELRREHGALLDAAAAGLLDAILDRPETPAGGCGGSGAAATVAEGDRRPGPAPSGVLLQDQDGVTTALEDLLADRVTLAAFFYTRCANPRKCSRTVAALGELAGVLKRADATGVRVLGITYDPTYDDPPRLRRYGRARGVPFGPEVRLARAVEGDERLGAHLDLAVGYTGRIVNRHAVQLFLLGPDGAVRESWTREVWGPEQVAATALTHVREVLGHPVPADVESPQSNDSVR